MEQKVIIPLNFVLLYYNILTSNTNKLNKYTPISKTGNLYTNYLEVINPVLPYH